MTRKTIHEMSVPELKQYARELGLSSVTRLSKKADLIAAIQEMRRKFPEQYGYLSGR